MKYNWFEAASPPAKFILALALMFICVFIAVFLSVVIAVPVFHRDIVSIFSAISDISNPNNIPIMKYFQVVQSIAFFLLPSFILAILFGHKPADYLKLKKQPTLYLVVITGIIVIASVPFINYLEEINSKLHLPAYFKSIESWMKNSEENADIISEKFLKVSSISGLIFNLFMMALIPALGEEFIFRGIFQRLFSEMFKNYHWGIIISAAFFSAFHLQFYGFIPRMLLGVIFGYMLVWSGTMWLPVIAHFTNNALGVIYYFLNFKGLLSDNAGKIGANGQAEGFITTLSIVFIFLLMYIFFKHCEKNKMSTV